MIAVEWTTGGALQGIQGSRPAQRTWTSDQGWPRWSGAGEEPGDLALNELLLGRSRAIFVNAKRLLGHPYRGLGCCLRIGWPG